MKCIIPMDRSTRITKTSSTILDHFYTNELINNINCKIILSDITDHFQIFININCVGIRTKNFHKNSFTRDTNQFVTKNFFKRS